MGLDYSTMTKQKVWFITGASRGFGRELAKQVSDRGDIVVATSRSGKLDLAAAPDRLHLLPLDVTDRSQVRATVERALAIQGRLDVVVNNAGYGLFGAIEEANEDQLRRMFEVNFFGAWNVIQAVLPGMRARRSGHLVNFSSIGGLVTAPGTGLYSASKFALEGMSQSLAQELAPLGIHVTIVEPGSFRTDFLSSASLEIATGKIADYEASAHAIVARLKARAGRQPGDPVRGVQVIIDAINAPEPARHLVLGPEALHRLEERQKQFAAEVERWRAVASETDLPRT
jgi:NAD(P)-dependent dehydrogenase (short-subunit alcohol dehydrogenase family)